MANEQLDGVDRRILDLIQWNFPIVINPFGLFGEAVGTDEHDVIKRLQGLRRDGIIREISAVFDAERLGYHSSLAAMAVAPDRLEPAAAVVSAHPGVSHNYERDHEFNLWFTMTVPRTVSIRDEVARLAREARIEPNDCLVLPALRRFKIGVDFDLGTRGDDEGVEGRARHTPVPAVAPPPPPDWTPPADLREVAAIRALQRDLPLEPDPFARLGEPFGLAEDTLVEFLIRFLSEGVARRYGAVLRHQRVGYTANAMGCWRIAEERIEEAGRRAADERAVSHCYERPAHPPKWPFNFFTMIHGRTEDEVREVAGRLREDLKPLDEALLFTGREFKKQRVRYFEE
jgi:DNA-binding Lrp family transcriptional regulator